MNREHHRWFSPSLGREMELLVFGQLRRWLRRLGWWALFIVVVQGLLGGKRVLLDSIAVPGFEMTLGQMLRIPHGILAQVFVCVLFAIAAGLSKSWIDAGARGPDPSGQLVAGGQVVFDHGYEGHACSECWGDYPGAGASPV